MAKFTYTREIPAAFTLSNGKDYHLHQGGIYELPADNEYIVSLIEQDFLEPAPNKRTKSANNLEN